MRPKGFEPPTLRLEGACSIQLSYGRVIKLGIQLCDSTNERLPLDSAFEVSLQGSD